MVSAMASGIVMHALLFTFIVSRWFKRLLLLVLLRLLCLWQDFGCLQMCRQSVPWLQWNHYGKKKLPKLVNHQVSNQVFLNYYEMEVFTQVFLTFILLEWVFKFYYLIYEERIVWTEKCKIWNKHHFMNKT